MYDIVSASVISGSIRQLEKTIKAENIAVGRLTKAMYLLAGISILLTVIQIIIR